MPELVWAFQALALGPIWRGSTRLANFVDVATAAYRLVRLVLDLLVLRGRRDRSKDAEILVLRYQLAVAHRRVPRPRFESADRVFLTAFARALGRDRWAIFLERDVATGVAVLAGTAAGDQNSCRKAVETLLTSTLNEIQLPYPDLGSLQPMAAQADNTCNAASDSYNKFVSAVNALG